MLGRSVFNICMKFVFMRNYPRQACFLLTDFLFRLNLSRQTGNDPCLVGLLRVYKDYYPEIIVGEAVRGRASAFKVGSISFLRLSLD